MGKRHLADAVLQLLGGEIVDVMYASGSADCLCIGDFRKMGWSRKHVDRHSWGYYWLGKGTIRVNGNKCYTNEVANARGKCLGLIEVDWS